MQPLSASTVVLSGNSDLFSRNATVAVATGFGPVAWQLCKDHAEIIALRAALALRLPVINKNIDTGSVLNAISATRCGAGTELLI
jgi:hypothetical protein